jgi:hypothetical protein
MRRNAFSSARVAGTRVIEAFGVATQCATGVGQPDQADMLDSVV